MVRWAQPTLPTTAKSKYSQPLRVGPPVPTLWAVRVLHAGPPGEVICWAAEHRGCDLIVMGTHGHTALKHLLLGSVTEYVVQHARCPVLTVADKPTGEPPLPEPLALPPKAPRFM